ncbi:MAG TPA: double zinc ribbon domain-containing protein [Casimicrobiaceae bacterium]|jgi:ComF family protein|nr:double zinc ribbon domain-containing protein [Gemmatimonadaceae bacterium]
MRRSMIAGAWRSPSVRRAAAALGDLLLPRSCVACARLLDYGDRGLVCGRCWSRVHELPYPRCERCGHPLAREHCAWCEMLPPYVRAARSVCWIPGETAGAIVHALKYAGWRGVAEPMAARMARLPWPEDVLAERTAYVPVPLAPTRLRERGYNQSALLALALAARCHVPVRESCLVRTRRTATQTRLTPEERRHNVSGAFAVPASERPTIRGAHLVLVDDVITTGATLGECAATLFAAGARIISIVTFGRAPAIGDAG